MAEFEALVAPREGPGANVYTQKALEDFAERMVGKPVRVGSSRYAPAVGEVVSAHVDSRGVVALLRCPEIGLAPEAVVEAEPDGIEFQVSREASVPMTDEEYATVRRDGLVVLPRYEWPEPSAETLHDDGLVVSRAATRWVEPVNLFQVNCAAVRAQRDRLVVIAVVDLGRFPSPWMDHPDRTVLIEHTREALTEALDR